MAMDIFEELRKKKESKDLSKSLEELSKRKDPRLIRITEELMKSKEVNDFFDTMDYLLKHSEKNLEGRKDYFDKVYNVLNSFYAKFVKLSAQLTYYDESDVYDELSWRENTSQHKHLLENKINLVYEELEYFVDETSEVLQDFIELMEYTREERIIEDSVKNRDIELFSAFAMPMYRLGVSLLSVNHLGNEKYKEMITKLRPEYDRYDEYVSNLSREFKRDPSRVSDRKGERENTTNNLVFPDDPAFR